MEDAKKLKNMLFNAITGWYDDSLTDYHGLDDEDFVQRVCKLTNTHGQARGVV